VVVGGCKFCIHYVDYVHYVDVKVESDFLGIFQGDITATYEARNDFFFLFFFENIFTFLSLLFHTHV
jgi:hypothetical protein